MAGEIGGMKITPELMLLLAVIILTPLIMAFLSLTLKGSAIRWTNIIVGILQIVVLIGALIGETWVYYIFATVVEVLLLLLVIWYAWSWPKQEG